jgi:hypothetical protein
MVDDVESEWLYSRNHFDYIHTRHTVQAFRKWPTLFSRAFKYVAFTLTPFATSSPGF